MVVATRDDTKPRLQGVFEYGSKYVKVAVVFLDNKFKWAFLDHKTNLPLHEYDGDYRSCAEALQAVDRLLSPENRTRKL